MDGAKPLGCTPSTQVVGRVRDRTDLLAQLHQVHVLASITGFLGAVIGMLLLGGLLREVPDWRRLGLLGTADALLVDRARRAGAGADVAPGTVGGPARAS